MICRKLYCAVETAPWFASGYVLWVIFRFFYFLLVSVRARVAMAATRLHRVAVCPAGFCPSCSSLVFFVSLLLFAIDASQSRCCSFFPSSRFTFYFSSLPPNVVVLPPSSGFLSPPHPLSSLFFLLQDQTGLSCRTCWLTCGTPRTCPPCSRP